MKTTILVFNVLTLLLASVNALNGNNKINSNLCPGSRLNQYCCVSGTFSGPLLSSVRSQASSLRSSGEALGSSIRSSALSMASSLRAEATAQGDNFRGFGRGQESVIRNGYHPYSKMLVGEKTGDGTGSREVGREEEKEEMSPALITPAPDVGLMRKRAVTTEVTEGLTCIGESLTVLEGDWNGYNIVGDGNVIGNYNEQGRGTVTATKTKTETGMELTGETVRTQTTGNSGISSAKVSMATLSANVAAAMQTGAPILAAGLAVALAHIVL